MIRVKDLQFEGTGKDCGLRKPGSEFFSACKLLKIYASFFLLSTLIPINILKYSTEQFFLPAVTEPMVPAMITPRFLDKIGQQPCFFGLTFRIDA